MLVFHFTIREKALILGALVVLLLVMMALVLLVRRCCYCCLCCRRNSDEIEGSASEADSVSTYNRVCYCCWWCRDFVQRRRQGHNVRDFDTLQDLLLEVENDETGRVVEHAAGDENDNNNVHEEQEISIETFFPNLLQPKKPNKKRHSSLHQRNRQRPPLTTASPEAAAGADGTTQEVEVSPDLEQAQETALPASTEQQHESDLQEPLL